MIWVRRMWAEEFKSLGRSRNRLLRDGGFSIPLLRLGFVMSGLKSTGFAALA